MDMYYVVEGRSEFPQDMLRRDSSKPVDEKDWKIINAEIGDDILLADEGGRKRLLKYRIKLATESKFAPNTKRWESFGFRVVEVGPGLYGTVSEAAPGRPREHPEGSSSLDRAKLSDRLLKESGGVRRTIRLSAEALSAIEAIRAATGEASDTAVIERAVIEKHAAIERAAAEEGTTPRR